MTDLTQLDIKTTIELLRKREISAVELTEAHLKKAEAENQKYNAFTEITRDYALNQASDSDRRYANNNSGIIDGIPLGVKDLYCTKGIETTACSKILSGFKPQYESTVTANLFANGGIMIGKTNMDEFAMGSTNSNSARGRVVNPRKRNTDDAELTPGGSSGGSAAAVAACQVMGALGSDTGGSIRQPAAFTGTVGIKPTYGRCSRWGMIAFASSLDQAGVFARTTYDAALLLEAIAGYDPKDSTSANVEVPKFSDATSKSIKGMKIGIPKEYNIEGLSSEISKLWEQGKEWLKAAGAEIVDISLPNTKYALPTYYIIAPAEASSNLARYDGVRYGLRVNNDGGSIDDMYMQTRAEGFGDEVKRRIMIGTYVLSAGYYDAYYIKALKIRRIVANDFKEAFKNVDAILTPATPTPAFGLGENIKDPVQIYLNDVFTVTANLAGLPGIAVPAGHSSNGLPLGLQILGNTYDEGKIISVASEIERAAQFVEK